MTRATDPASPAVSADATALWDEVRALDQLLAYRPPRFSLASAVCDDLVLRQRVIADLSRSHPEVSIVDVTSARADPFAAANWTAPVSPGGLFVIGLPSWLSDAENNLRRAAVLNASRELWFERFSCPVVLWLNQIAAQWLALHAPDLWRYRSHRFEFNAPRPIAGREADGFYQSESSSRAVQVGRRAERVDELQQRIASVPAMPPPSLRRAAVGWQLELAELAAMDGDLARSEQLSRDARAATADTDPDLYAAATAAVGVAALRRGDLELADALLTESLDLNRKFGWLAGQAVQLSNLGLVKRSCGDLAQADRLTRESLALSRQLKRSDGEAIALGNLGLVELDRGDLDAADRLACESLAINQKSDCLEGEAGNMMNLGLVAQSRGDLDRAAELFGRSLELNRQLDRVEGQANALGNLGVVFLERGDLEAAAANLQQALQLNRRLGRVHGQANQICNLGLLELARGNLDAAERLLNQALDLDHGSGRLEGQAHELAGLGLVERSRGRLDVAERLLNESLSLDRMLGRVESQASTLGNLGSIAREQGDRTLARERWELSRTLFRRAGMVEKARRVDGWINDLPPV